METDVTPPGLVTAGAGFAYLPGVWQYSAGVVAVPGCQCVKPDLQIRCLVDGKVMQDARTSDMVFGPVDIVAYVSRIVTLWPGDMVFTGTPTGVGVTRNPGGQQ